ncbi:MAG: bactofilin family protein [Formosimonas sp.]
MFGHKKNETTLSNSDITSLVGENCIIEGNITATAYLKVDGQVLGNLQIDGGIILGESGRIQGNLKSGEVIVYGQIDGDVSASHLQLKNTASITGNIQAQVLQIDPGAVYQGTISMQPKTSS